MKVSSLKSILEATVKDLDKLNPDSEIYMTDQVCGYETGELPLDGLRTRITEGEEVSDPHNIEFWFRMEVM